MPEMPEVEIIRRGLAGKLVDCQIIDADILLPRLIKWPGIDDFSASVVGRIIKQVNRQGKYLLFVLDNGNNLVFHLRMTGRLCWVAAGAEQDAYRRIVFALDSGDSLVYADTRTLGTVYVLPQEDLWRISGLASLGPEPLSEAFTAEYLSLVLAKKRTKIKSFLLNQKYIGGLGNIYADEALAVAGIHPLRTAETLLPDEVKRLHAAVNQVIAEGIADGGTTFRDYRNGEGKAGHHQERLLVYGRDKKPCQHCGNVIEKIEVGGRGTHFCPHCQVLEGK